MLRGVTPVLRLLWKYSHSLIQACELVVCRLECGLRVTSDQDQFYFDSCLCSDRLFVDSPFAAIPWGYHVVVAGYSTDKTTAQASRSFS